MAKVWLSHYPQGVAANVNVRIGFSSALFSLPMAPRAQPSTRVFRSLKVTEDC